MVDRIDSSQFFPKKNNELHATGSNNSKIKNELAEKLREALRNGKPAKLSPEVKEEINKIVKKLHNSPLTFQQKIDKEETEITNLIDRGKQPLQKPKEKPTLITTGPNGGKLEQFPQRANGTYYTIETLPNGETRECTYSETGHLLNEIKRTGLSTQITTFHSGYTDTVTISDLPGQEIVGKIQVGNLNFQSPPTLEEITGKPLLGFSTK